MKIKRIFEHRHGTLFCKNEINHDAELNVVWITGSNGRHYFTKGRRIGHGRTFWNFFVRNFGQYENNIKNVNEFIFLHKPVDSKNDGVLEYSRAFCDALSYVEKSCNYGKLIVIAESYGAQIATTRPLPSSVVKLILANPAIPGSHLSWKDFLRTIKYSSVKNVTIKLMTGLLNKIDTNHKREVAYNIDKFNRMILHDNTVVVEGCLYKGSNRTLYEHLMFMLEKRIRTNKSMQTDGMVVVSGQQVWSKYNVRYLNYDDNHLALMTKEYQSYLIKLSLDQN